MNVAWLFDDTTVSGPARAALALADEMSVRGHRVRAVTAAAPLMWRSSRAEWIFVDELVQYDAGSDDLVIATTRASATVAAILAGPRAAHYYFDEPADGVTVLSALDANATGDAVYIGTVVDEEVYRDVAPREHQPPRVLLAGAAHEEARGIDDGYGAVAHARWFHQKLELVRVSPWVPSREEPLDDVQEFHVGLSNAEMTRLLHSCDVVLVPSLREQRLSLVVLEALAAGLPLLVTSISPHVRLHEAHDYALFAPEGNAVELGERLIELLSDSELRTRLRERGRELAAQWRSHHAADRLDRFLRGRSG